MSEVYEDIAGLSREKKELLELLLQEEGVDLSQFLLLPVERDREEFPLSFGQERLWFLDQLAPGSPIYNIAFAARLVGDLRVEALTAAFEAIIQRHETLRTTFRSIGGRPVQVVSPTPMLTIPVIDLSTLEEAERREQTRRLARAEARRPFDLSKGPLIRVTLLRLAHDEHVILLVLHHIVSDGWSTGIIVSEFAEFYKSFVTGEPAQVRGLPVQYIDYAVRQREWLRGEVLEKQLAYWRDQLADSPQVLELPTDYPRPAVQSYAGASETFIVSAELTRSLRQLCRQEGVTLFMALLAAFQTLLYRYTGQRDINVGTPIANRNRSEVEGLIGFFVNTLVLRTRFSERPTFRELLQQVRKTTLGAYEHQDLPFEKLVEVLQPQRDMSHSPLFQVMLVLHNAPTPTIELPGLQLSAMELDAVTAKFDIVLNMFEEQDQLRGVFEYNTDLFKADSINRMAQRLITLLQAAVRNPDHRVDALPLLAASEREAVLVHSTGPQVRRGPKECVHEMLEAKVREMPDAIAVVSDDGSLTYSELNSHAQGIAERLRAHGVKPEMPVAVFCRRTSAAIAAILGIFKSGGTYLPLDPDYPKERTSFILEDAGVRFILCQADMVSRLPENRAEVIPVDSLPGPGSTKPASVPLVEVDPDNLAYIIYTSGSTGFPKGVMVSHRELADHCLSMVEHYGLTSVDRVLQFAALNFDASLEQIVPPLLAGATVVFRGDDIWSPSEFFRRAESLGLSVVNPPTAYWEQLVLEDLGNKATSGKNRLRLVVVGGQEMPVAALQRWRQTRFASVRLLNVYGPTETTITATTYEVPGDFDANGKTTRVPIGRPLPNRRTYVLDWNGELLPIGVTGELCLGGAGLARGYLNRPDTTAESFVPDPFSPESGSRMYRTGDLARLLPDGAVEFMGRKDYQVKVRGFRVELEEIERVLEKHPNVSEAVVALKEGRAGDKKLVGYVVPTGEAELAIPELRRFLVARLPSYMVPAILVLMDKIPKTSVGKPNRALLPAPDQDRFSALDNAYVAPRTPVEETIARICAELLQVERVGIFDNFFDLGGHSLLGTQLISRLREAFNVEVPLRTLFQAPTVAELSLEVTGLLAEEERDREVELLLDEIEQLSDEEVARLLEQEVRPDS